MSTNCYLNKRQNRKSLLCYIYKCETAVSETVISEQQTNSANIFIGCLYSFVLNPKYRIIRQKRTNCSINFLLHSIDRNCGKTLKSAQNYGSDFDLGFRAIFVPFFFFGGGVKKCDF